MSVDLAAAAVVASMAALIDIRWRRIPNWLTFTALPLGMLLQALHAGAAGVLVALGGAALGLCLLLPFYVIRAMGAGDVKLLAALGALLGPGVLLSVAIYAGIAGGLISAILLARRHQLAHSVRDILHNPFRLRRRGATAPYAVAIASGVYLSMLLPRVIG